MSSNDLSSVTRLELIHHEPCDSCGGDGMIVVAGQVDVHECPACYGEGFLGREVVFHNEDMQIESSLQDDGRTLKIFIDKRSA